jgi:hypothetical protein
MKKLLFMFICFVSIKANSQSLNNKGLIGSFWSDSDAAICIEINSNSILFFYHLDDNSVYKMNYKIQGDQILFNDEDQYDKGTLTFKKLKSGLSILEGDDYRGFVPTYKKVTNYAVAKSNYDYNKKKLFLIDSIKKNNLAIQSSSPCPPGDMRILDKQIQGTARKYQASDGHYYYQVVLWVNLSQLQMKYYSYLEYSAYGASNMDDVKKSIGEKMVINKVLENTRFSVMPKLKCVVQQFVFGNIYFRDLKQIN